MNHTDVPNQPHAIVVLSLDGSIKPVFANPGYGMDENYAIYPNRREAAASVKYWSGREFDTVRYFTVPASILFDQVTVTKEVFKIRG